MKVLLAGKTGMIGNLILNHCLESHLVSEVRCLVRKKTEHRHGKQIEHVIEDFEDYTTHSNIFRDINAAFFCVGVYTGQVPDEQFKKITVDYTVAFGKALEKWSPGATLCLLSGAGADRTEKSSTSFARYKGIAENRLAILNLKFYSFRPAYIYPVESRIEPNFGYSIFRFFYPLIKVFGKKYSIKSTDLATAMFNVGLYGTDQQILENKDIQVL